MAKLALINREAKRAATVAKYAAKRAALKAIINDATRSMEERLEGSPARREPGPPAQSLRPDRSSPWHVPQVRSVPWHDS